LARHRTLGFCDKTGILPRSWNVVGRARRPQRQRTLKLIPRCKLGGRAGECSRRDGKKRRSSFENLEKPCSPEQIPDGRRNQVVGQNGSGRLRAKGPPHQKKGCAAVTAVGQEAVWQSSVAAARPTLIDGTQEPPQPRLEERSSWPRRKRQVINPFKGGII
jgi:hypothetical protein